MVNTLMADLEGIVDNIFNKNAGARPLREFFGFPAMKWVLRTLIILVATLSISIGASHAGEVHEGFDGECDLEYFGPVQPGDLDKIKASGIEFGSRLCLDSAGGDFTEGVAIAEWLVESGVKTVIRAEAVYFSACSVVFMGGGFFEEIYLPQRELYEGGQLGFNAPYPAPSPETYTSEQLAMAFHLGLEAVAKMMMLGAINSDDKGFIPPSIILELLKMPPDEAYMINTGARIRKLDIEYKGLTAVQWGHRSIMNACSSVLEQDGSPTLPSQYPAMEIPNDQGSIDIWYEGYGAEASGFCVYRVARDGARMVAVPVWDPADLAEIPFIQVTDADTLSVDQADIR